MHVYTKIYTSQVRCCRASLDSLSMDGAEVAVNCLVRSQRAVAQTVSWLTAIVVR